MPNYLIQDALTALYAGITPIFSLLTNMPFPAMAKMLFCM
jgi:hypothetical protein